MPNGVPGGVWPEHRRSEDFGHGLGFGGDGRVAGARASAVWPSGGQAGAPGRDFDDERRQLGVGPRRSRARVRERHGERGKPREMLTVELTERTTELGVAWWRRNLSSPPRSPAAVPRGVRRLRCGSGRIEGGDRGGGHRGRSWTRWRSSSLLLATPEQARARLGFRCGAGFLHGEERGEPERGNGMRGLCAGAWHTTGQRGGSRGGWKEEVALGACAAATELLLGAGKKTPRCEVGWAGWAVALGAR